MGQEAVHTGIHVQLIFLLLIFYWQANIPLLLKAKTQRRHHNERYRYRLGFCFRNPYYLYLIKVHSKKCITHLRS
jgi:hypothetical protein